MKYQAASAARAEEEIDERQQFYELFYRPLRPHFRGSLTRAYERQRPKPTSAASQTCGLSSGAEDRGAVIA